MAKLLSGSTLRRGGSGEFIDLKGAQPQLPPTDTTATGFTLATDSLLRTTYRSSLGFVEFSSSTMYSALPSGSIRVLATGTTFASTSTDSGTLVVTGGVGIGANLYVKDDINVNGITIGTGFEGINNIVVRGAASEVTPEYNSFDNGHENIAIGYDTLQNLDKSHRNVAIGRYAISTGTGVSNTIAIGDSALKDLGIVPQSLILPISSVTVKSPKTISTITNTNPVVVTTVELHELTTGSRISITGVQGLSTGTQSLVNNNGFWVVPLDEYSFELYSDPSFSEASFLNGGLAYWSAYESSGTVIRPLEITAVGNDYTTGTRVIFNNIGGLIDENNIDYPVELNGNSFYVNPISAAAFQVYHDSIIGRGVDGTLLTPYTGGGTSERYLYKDGNVGIGTNAGKSLYDGELNFFLGYDIAKNLTTGSYNFLLGHEVGNNLTKGSGNVSIMGDNLVDGVDNQVNIGGVFYYNGKGYLRLNADTTLGLGSTATGGNTGGLAVFGGVSVSDNLVVSSTATSVNSTSGAIVVSGGIGVGKSVVVGEDLTVGPISTGTSVSALYSNNVLLASYTSNSITGTLSQNLDAFDATLYRTAKYMIQVVDGSSVHITEISLFHDDTEVYIIEYGVSTNTGELGVFDASLADNVVTLTFTPINATSMVIKVVRMGITK
jgi:hypothetical protein